MPKRGGGGKEKSRLVITSLNYYITLYTIMPISYPADLRFSWNLCYSLLSHKCSLVCREYSTREKLVGGGFPLQFSSHSHSHIPIYSNTFHYVIITLTGNGWREQYVLQSLLFTQQREEFRYQSACDTDATVSLFCGFSKPWGFLVFKLLQRFFMLSPSNMHIDKNVKKLPCMHLFSFL